MGEKIPRALIFKFRRVKAQLLLLRRARLEIFELLWRNRLGLALRRISFGIPIGIFSALREALRGIWLVASAVLREIPREILIFKALRGGGFGVLTLIGALTAPQETMTGILIGI